MFACSVPNSTVFSAAFGGRRGQAASTWSGYASMAAGGVLAPPELQPEAPPRRFVGPRPGSLEAAQLLHDGIVVQPRRPSRAKKPQPKPPPRAAKQPRSASAVARILSARAPRRHRHVQHRARKATSARGANEVPPGPFKYTGSWQYDDGSERAPERPASQYVHQGAVFGFTDVPDVVNSARLAGTARRSDTKNHPDAITPSPALPQDEHAGQVATKLSRSRIRNAAHELEHEDLSRARWASHTVRISGIEINMASDLVVRDALAPLGGVFDCHVKQVTHDVFGGQVDNLSWALVSFVNKASAERAMQRSERVIAGCRETLAWKFHRVHAQADTASERCDLEPDPGWKQAQVLEPPTAPTPCAFIMDWDNIRLPIAEALARARQAYREGNVSRAVELVDDFINEHPSLTSEQRSQVRSLYSALLAQQAVAISSTREDGSPLSRSPSPTSPARNNADVKSMNAMSGDFPAYQPHDIVYDLFKQPTPVDLLQSTPRRLVVSLESELFANDFERPTLPMRVGAPKGRHARRPFSTEQANKQSKITALYSEAQKNAQAAMHGGANKAAPFLRKATAEAALGSHLTSMRTANDGLAVAPNDPKLIRRFQTGYPWAIQDRYYRNEILRPRPVYQAVDAVVEEEVVAVQDVPKERTLQEMPPEWRRIDIMDMLLEQEKLLKAFDEVFAIPADEVEYFKSLTNFDDTTLAMMVNSQAAQTGPVSTQTLLKVMRCVNEANRLDFGSGSRSLTAGEYKGFKERLEQALYTKGKKGGLRMLDPDDIQLLYSLRPADPHKDFEGILNELNESRGQLKVVFKLYCMEGGDATKGIEGMGKNQFGVFCDQSELDEDNLEQGGNAISLATIDRIFIRANYDRSAESQFRVESPESKSPGRGSSPVGGRKSPSSPADTSPPKTQDEDTSQMNLVEFVAACVRLAYHRYRDPSLTERVHKFMQLLAENPCFSAIDDEICRRMATSYELEAIFNKHELGLRHAFMIAASLNNHKAESGKTTGEKKQKKSKLSKRGTQARGKKGVKAAASEPRQQDTIDLDEWIHFLNMYGLLNAKLTIREARMIFVQTNLDDELYVQEDGNDSSQIVFDEFLECVVRCAVATYEYEFSHETAHEDFKAENKKAVAKRIHVEEGGEASNHAMASWGVLKKNRAALNIGVKGDSLVDKIMQLTARQRIGNGPDGDILEGNAGVPELLNTADAKMCRQVFRARCSRVAKGDQLGYDMLSLFDWLNGADELITRDEFVYYLSKHIPPEFNETIIPTENLEVVFDAISGGDGAVSFVDFEQFLLHGDDFESKTQTADVAVPEIAGLRGAFEEFIDAYIEHEFLAEIEPAAGGNKK